jgi:subtilisin family serine protease
MNFNRKKINNINNPSILSSLKKYGVYGLSLLFSSRVSNQIDNGIWYKAYLEEGLDAKNVIQQISVSGLTDVVELNYIYENEAISFPEVLDNPKIQDQWYLENAGIQDAWQSLKQQGLNPGGAASVITAVIDTGVDYTHNDLISSMWRNPGEIPNNGIDDDGNGYIDDIYGVNLVSDSRFHSGNPMDDHGHGTHVAGIIAAANNNVGIVGVAYNTKIMAIKAGNSSGYFLQTDIAEAIIYAYENGADVINMSFGGPTATTLVQDALSVAYTTSVLVAAAGNSALPNEGKKPMGVPFYPASYPFVIGVMSSSRTNKQSLFTNFDVFSGSKFEYELFSPGEGITSTIPGNSYATWSGTSMAAPIVSGVAALLRTKYVNPSIYPNKFIISQIVSTAKVFGSGSNNKILSAIDSLNSIPKPSISIFDSFIMDGLDLSNKNNNDATVDAGETINIAVTLNNRWGMASEVVAELSILDTNHITIINNTISYNSIGTYSLKDNGIVRNDGLIVGIANPFTFIVSDSAPNDFIINFNLKISYYNGLDTSDLTNYQVNRKLEFVISNWDNKIYKNFILKLFTNQSIDNVRCVQIEIYSSMPQYIKTN